LDICTRATWFIVAIWFIACIAMLNYNGAFFDEGIYVTGGLRTLEGHGLSDRYLSWFGGSLFWPVLAGVGYELGGIVGARVIAVLVGAVALGAVARAARNLFNSRVGFWTALAFAINSAFIAMARLAVYDALALAGVAVSFWAVTELACKDHRGWLALAAVAYTAAIFAKYPMGLMLAPILGVLIHQRQGRAPTDIAIFGFITGALSLAFFLPVREQLSAFFSWRLSNTPSFGISLSAIAMVIGYFSFAPVLLTVGGWWVASKRDKCTLASILGLSLLIWPAYHLLRQDPVSTNKHLVFGFLFAYPLVGLALAWLWERDKVLLGRRLAITIVVGLAALGWVQVKQSDQAWPDHRAGAHYLVEQVEPGQQLLIDESWPYTMYLYSAGCIEAPWDVYDNYRVEHEELPVDLCEFDWLVNVKGSYAWPDEFLDTIEQCDRFESVFSDTSTVVGLGSNLRYVSYPVETVILRNTMER